jgi:hypothetical protein
MNQELPEVNDNQIQGKSHYKAVATQPKGPRKI